MTAVAFNDPTNWLEVDAATWVSILTVTAELDRLQSGEFDLYFFSQSVGASPPVGALADALEIIHELGEDDGRELIIQAAADQNIPIEISDDVPARELAARLWIQSQSDATIAKILVVAQIGLSNKAADRVHREYLCGQPLHKTLDKVQIKNAVEAWCKEQKKYAPVEIIAYQKDGVYSFDILRGDSMKRVSEIRNNRPAILNYRPARADYIRYEPASGRIGISTRSPQLLTVYRELLGTMLGDRADFFSDKNVCDLEPLRKNGKDLFESCRPAEILRIDVVMLAWRRGDKDRLVVNGNDCFQVLSDLGAKLIEGKLTEARLKIAVAGRRRAGHVYLKVSNQIDIKGMGVHEELVRSFLSAVGIRGTAKNSDSTAITWAKYPYRLTEQQWRQDKAATFDLLLGAEIFRPITLESVAHAQHPNVPNALTVAHLPGGQPVGISDDLAIPVRTLSPTDVQGYEVNWAAQGKLIADATQLIGEVTEVESGLWYLGVRQFTPASSVCVYMATRQPSAHSNLVMQQKAAGAKHLLLIPADCSCDNTCSTVRMELPSISTTGLLQRMIEVLGWEAVVPVHLWHSADLIIDTRTKQAWYRRIELTALAADSHPYKFALEVASAHGQVCSSAELNKKLSESRIDSEPAKSAKSHFNKVVKKSFEAAGLPFPLEAKTLFVAKGNGYALNAAASAKIL